jgi:catechol-2,3-dioxygenase
VVGLVANSLVLAVIRNLNTRSNFMTHRGFSHVGLSTLDLDKTREFYEDVLGFKAVVADTIEVKAGASDTSFSISGAIS